MPVRKSLSATWNILSMSRRTHPDELTLLRNGIDMKLLPKILFVISLAIASASSFATCTAIGTINKTINFGNVVVQRDTPVGTVIATTYSSATGMTASCTAPNGYEYDKMMYQGGVSTNISQVYQTNIPGVGIYGYHDSARWVFLNPSNSQYISIASGGSQNDYGQTFQLIKTGAITSGTLARSVVAQVSYDGSPNTPGIVINMGSGTVTQVACSINTPNVNVPLDPMLSSSFTAINSTLGAKPFTIGLSCDAGARINASLSFTQNAETSNNSVIALTGAGTSSVATGVGIQLLYGGTILTNNNNIVLKTSTGGQEFPAGAFTARYFQTKSTVTTGDANATATLNLTYQ